MKPPISNPDDLDVTLEEVKESYDNIGSDLLRAMALKSKDNMAMLLYHYGDPKEYRGYIQFATVLCETTLVWLLATGYVTLTPKGQVTDEDRDARLVSVQPVSRIDGGGYA